jgi:hypothetical protein
MICQLYIFGYLKQMKRRLIKKESKRDREVLGQRV